MSWKPHGYSQSGPSIFNTNRRALLYEPHPESRLLSELRGQSLGFLKYDPKLARPPYKPARTAATWSNSLGLARLRSFEDAVPTASTSPAFTDIELAPNSPGSRTIVGTPATPSRKLDDRIEARARGSKARSNNSHLPFSLRTWLVLVMVASHFGCAASLWGVLFTGWDKDGEVGLPYYGWPCSTIRGE
ncbi:hypothetical protein GY45DRAFT_19528 [Cubamyces sp. BRFM 1775]|nr:hypothetical protein GY45DRAFT_19528 [Cubamyces sp. BRFM 1775]